MKPRDIFSLWRGRAFHGPFERGCAIFFGAAETLCVGDGGMELRGCQDLGAKSFAGMAENGG